MPNRILRDGILTSPRIKTLGWAEEVFYRRLMSVVDDFGRYYADPGLLRAGCYPRQLDKVSDSDIEQWLQATETAGLVKVYSSPDGEKYLELLDFRQQVRATKSKFPQPPSTCVADAKQTQSNAHLDVVVVVDVIEDVCVARTYSAGELSISMRKAGISSNPGDLRLIAIAEQGITPETVTAACDEAKRAKPNAAVSPGYIFAILERWAKEAKEILVAGASAPKKGGAWWATEAATLAKGLEMTPPMAPHRGEVMQAFKGRLQAAIDNGGKPPEQKPPPTVVTAGEPKRVEVPPELAAQRSANLKAALKKTA